MRTGSFSRTVWRRDGAKYFSARRGEILSSLTPDEMCASMRAGGDADFIWTETAVFGRSAQTGYYAVVKAAGDLAARGAEPAGVCVRLMLPAGCSEDDVAELAQGIEDACRRLNLQTACFQGEVSPAVTVSTVCISAAGILPGNRQIRCSMVKPGQTILLCGYTGLEGTLRILDEAGWKPGGEHPGDLSARYESGADGSSAIGYDKKGGTSYGRFQLSSKKGSMEGFLRFLEGRGGEAASIAARLRAAGPSRRTPLSFQ